MQWMLCDLFAVICMHVLKHPSGDFHPAAGKPRPHSVDCGQVCARPNLAPEFVWQEMAKFGRAWPDLGEIRRSTGRSSGS